ncbi:unnamed protein product [Acidithrix sp. C25]|nr:unnamed protein product [Acidithrix sp. C25]
MEIGESGSSGNAPHIEIDNSRIDPLNFAITPKSSKTTEKASPW